MNCIEYSHLANYYRIEISHSLKVKMSKKERSSPLFESLFTTAGVKIFRAQ